MRSPYLVSIFATMLVLLLSLSSCDPITIRGEFENVTKKNTEKAPEKEEEEEEEEDYVNKEFRRIVIVESMDMFEISSVKSPHEIAAEHFFNYAEVRINRILHRRKHYEIRSIMTNGCSIRGWNISNDGWCGDAVIIKRDGDKKNASIISMDSEDFYLLRRLLDL